MLRSLVILLSAASVLCVGRAIPPPTTLPLPDVVKLASHVFVGTIEDFCVVDLDGHRVEPEPKTLRTAQSIQLKVRVNEVLYPKSWNTNYVRVLYCRDDVDQIRKALVGKEWIYLTRFNEGTSYGGSAFVSAHGLNLFEPLHKRQEIEQLILKKSK